MKHTAKTNGAFVRTARDKLGISQVEFAERLGVTSRTVIRWEQQGSGLKRRDRIAITLMLEQPRKSQEIT